MIVLGIETSGRSGGVALWRDGDCLEERSLEQLRRRHAQTLVAEIDRLLRKFELSPRDVELVAVSLGPGSFTGLRVGVVCAKTFAYAVGCEVAGVDTFQGIAEYSPADIDEVFVIDDAQRGDLFVGRYRRVVDRTWQREREIAIFGADAWFDALKPGDVVTGPGVDKFEERLSGKCRLIEAALRKPLAAVVAELGKRKFDAGQTDDFWSLEPFYLRKSAAEEKWEADRQDANS